jgi:hypothetical protein
MIKRETSGANRAAGAGVRDTSNWRKFDELGYVYELDWRQGHFVSLDVHIRTG